jgi:hypothetical protein
MAGIQLLVNQATNSTWGNPNTVYHQLANTEYGTGGNAGCNSLKPCRNATQALVFRVVSLLRLLVNLAKNGPFDRHCSRNSIVPGST